MPGRLTDWSGLSGPSPKVDRVSHRELILHSALTRFALEGFLATSIQHIADDAGVSKATVLYHFSSKEDLLEEAIAPALKNFEHLINRVNDTDGFGGPANRTDFVKDFVPFLITNRLGIHIIVTHAHLAVNHPALSKAMALMSRMAELVDRSSTSDIDALRFGVALSGATYALVSETLLGLQSLSPEQLEAGLTIVLSDMIAPGRKAEGL
jgi:AcrR family transcriptional regulator